MPVSDIGVLCEGGCGKRVVPVSASDCAEQRGPWYCDDCYKVEAKRRRTEEAHRRFAEPIPPWAGFPVPS